MNKIFCDICKKDIIDINNEPSRINLEPHLLILDSYFEICEPCAKEIRRYIRIMIKEKVKNE